MMVEMLSALKGDLCLVWTINAIAAIDASRLGPVFGWKWLIAIHIYIYMLSWDSFKSPEAFETSLLQELASLELDLVQNLFEAPPTIFLRCYCWKLAIVRSHGLFGMRPTDLTMASFAVAPITLQPFSLKFLRLKSWPTIRSSQRDPVATCASCGSCA